VNVTVITALYGDIDDYRPICPQTVPHTDLLVTDRARGVDGEIVDPKPWLHPRFAAKLAKCQPWRYGDANIIVWRDANIHPTGPDWLRWMLDHHHGPISQFEHPHRDCIIEEAAASETIPKYAGIPVMEQAQTYTAAGHPLRWGLWAAGLIVYEWPFPYEHGARWLAEQFEHGPKDQISQPPVLRELGMRPHTLPGDIFQPPHAEIVAHRNEE